MIIHRECGVFPEEGNYEFVVEDAETLEKVNCWFIINGLAPINHQITGWYDWKTAQKNPGVLFEKELEYRKSLQEFYDSGLWK